MNIKKIISIFFCLIFFSFCFAPYVFASDREKVSLDENRTLSSKPELLADGQINPDFIQEYETWFSDNLGFRSDLINMKAVLLFDLFNVLDSKNYYLSNDHLVYATDSIVKDYLKLNVKSDQENSLIAQSYQTISDWLSKKDIPFYLVQCTDKQTIYPESMMDGLLVEDLQSPSRTDAIMEAVENETTVNLIYYKDLMMLKKEEGYDVYPQYGDPTHWSQRGAYFGYEALMETISADHPQWNLKILSEDDYTISIDDLGKSFHNNNIHFTDMLESFTISNPAASQVAQPAGSAGSDPRNIEYINDQAENDLTVLLLADSYIYSFILDDIAESFSRTILIHADFLQNLPELVEEYQPDLVILESAERVDRSNSVKSLAGKLS